MHELLKKALLGVSRSFEIEFATIPIERWNESVFRFLFSREIARLEPDVEQFVECQKIDLVLRRQQDTAFVEFKFYIHNHGFDAYTGAKLKSTKSHPSKKNEGQFRKCIQTLRNRPRKGSLRKFVVLFYADPTAASGRRYSQCYGDQALKEYGVAVLDSVSPICGPSKVDSRALLLECLPP